MKNIEDRGLSALAPGSKGLSTFDLHWNIVERALVLGGLASLATESALRAAGVGTTGRVMGVSLATLLTARLSYVASRKPGDASGGGLDRVNVGMSLGEVVLLPAAGGLTLLMTPEHRKEGAVLLGLSAAGGALAAAILSAK